jgi:drug/metabolite transporter (DMT)-like permease
VQSATRSAFAAGVAFAIAGSVLFSGKAIVVKLAYKYGVDAATLLALRMVFAVPFFIVALVVSSRNAVPLTKRDHLRLIVIGLLGYYASSYLDFLGLQYITAGLERLILYLSPTLVLLISAVTLGKPVGRHEWLAVAIAYCGIGLAVWHDLSFEEGRTSLGAALVFASAITYALYFVMSGEVVRRIGAIRLTSYAMCVSTAAIFIQFVILNPWSSLEQPSQVYALSVLNALLCTVLPVFATMLAIERIGAGRASVAGMIGPVSTIALAYVFLGERVSGWQLAGTALVLIGIYVLTRSGPKIQTALPKEEP